METRNNHQLVKQNQKLSFHYRVKDHSYSNEHPGPESLESYSISGKDLILTHGKYYSLELDATDAFRDWKLINVNMTDCDPKKLSRLIDDNGVAEIKIIEIKNGKKLIFYSDTEVYSFRCEEIEQEIRGYSRQEIIDILLKKEEYLREIDKQNSSFREFVIRLFRFINGESTDQKNLLAFHQNNNDLRATKSMHYLEMLTRVKDKLVDLDNLLLNHPSKYFDKLPGLG